MNQSFFQMALVVADYDEAISFYTEKMKFSLLEDTTLSETKRWVRVQPPGDGNGASLLLAKAASESQEASIGNQTGGRVFLFMHTDDCDRDFHYYKSQGIKIVRERTEHDYGKVFVIEDLYGNLWDIIQPPSL